MKKLIVFGLLASLLATTMSACATYKKDCQGGRHTRLANGVVI
jgi:hypothetical protein